MESLVFSKNLADFVSYVIIMVEKVFENHGSLQKHYRRSKKDEIVCYSTHCTKLLLTKKASNFFGFMIKSFISSQSFYIFF